MTSNTYLDPGLLNHDICQFRFYVSNNGFKPLCIYVITRINVAGTFYEDGVTEFLDFKKI